jgi:hypothetical protein
MSVEHRGAARPPGKIKMSLLGHGAEAVEISVRNQPQKELETISDVSRKIGNDCSPRHAHHWLERVLIS